MDRSGNYANVAKSGFLREFRKRIASRRSQAPYPRSARMPLMDARQMRLVRYRKVGKIAYYALDDDHIATLLQQGFPHVEELV